MLTRRSMLLGCLALYYIVLSEGNESRNMMGRLADGTSFCKGFESEGRKHIRFSSLEDNTHIAPYGSSPSQTHNQACHEPLATVPSPNGKAPPLFREGSEETLPKCSLIEISEITGP